MTTRNGTCLCGDLTFAVEGELRGIGQCHCSLCRKSTGTNGTMVFLVPNARFRWLAGEDKIKRYRLRDTYGSARCERCGSPAPVSHDGKHTWVPPGLMDDDLDVSLVLHHHVASIADWDEVPKGRAQFPEYPPAAVVFGDAD